jgi:hypothetical protein
MLLRNITELVTTLIELNAMSAAAVDGAKTKPNLGNKAPAASGIQIVLFAEFC